MKPEHDIARLIKSADAADVSPHLERYWVRDGDRTDAVARDWVRRWGPSRAVSVDGGFNPN
jgi:hypothetical protein